MQPTTRRVHGLIGISLIAGLSSCTDVGVTDVPNGNEQCAIVTPYTFGATAAGNLTSSDCRLGDGSNADYFGITLTGGWYQFDMSAAFPTYLVMRAADRTTIGVHDDVGHGANTALKVLLPAGNYLLEANAYPGISGAYTLTSESIAGDVTNCEIVFATKGTSTTQSLQTTDCTPGPSYSDDYIIFLAAGQSITVTMSSSAFDSFVEVYNRLGRAAFNDNSSTTTSDAQFTYTSLAREFHIISARSAGGLATGPYTIDIQ